MLRKKEFYTNITPIPRQIPRKLAIDMLHSHGEVITLNPLVLEHHPVHAPRDSVADEYYSTWYEITERIQYVRGLGKIGSGTVTFKGCFHDMPWGLQTHVYAPLKIDIRNKWSIGGNQPGEPREPREPRELGIDVPFDCLYLRENIEIRCNRAMLSFVKEKLKEASQVMVERFVRKAELLDAGVLRAMMDHGRLRTFNPADRTSALPLSPLSPISSPPSLSPLRQHNESGHQSYLHTPFPSSTGTAELSTGQAHAPELPSGIVVELSVDNAVELPVNSTVEPPIHAIELPTDQQPLPPIYSYSPYSDSSPQWCTNMWQASCEPHVDFHSPRQNGCINGLPIMDERSEPPPRYSDGPKDRH